jgi:hypothetical protein
MNLPMEMAPTEAAPAPEASAVPGTVPPAAFQQSAYRVPAGQQHPLRDARSLKWIPARL